MTAIRIDDSVPMSCGHRNGLEVAEPIQIVHSGPAQNEDVGVRKTSLNPLEEVLQLLAAMRD